MIGIHALLLRHRRSPHGHISGNLRAALARLRAHMFTREGVFERVSASPSLIHDWPSKCQPNDWKAAGTLNR